MLSYNLDNIETTHVMARHTVLSGNEKRSTFTSKVNTSLKIIHDPLRI
jgi:hypothetical protein